MAAEAAKVAAQPDSIESLDRSAPPVSCVQRPLRQLAEDARRRARRRTLGDRWTVAGAAVWNGASPDVAPAAGAFAAFLHTRKEPPDAR